MEREKAPYGGSTLGLYLKSQRAGLGMTLRGVEAATSGDVSNAYLSQLENGKIEQPSPHILYALAEVYGLEYENLMRRAGYLGADKKRGEQEKHGQAATFSIDNLSRDEEEELLNYLSYYRQRRDKDAKT